MNAVLALENGTWFRGIAAGAPGKTHGEVVFNTNMTGYQEVLTDPSYFGQVVTMTCPQIGNYGVAPEDVESPGPQVAGFVIREASPIASNWRADQTLREYLVDHGIVAIAGVDTRALTRLLRTAGVMRGVIATGAVDPTALSKEAQRAPTMEGSDLVQGVTCDQPFRLDTPGPDGRRFPRRAHAPVRTADAGRRVRLRDEAEHPASVHGVRLPRVGLPGSDARQGVAGDQAGWDLSQQWTGRPGTTGLRDRQCPGADRGRRADLRHLPRASSAGACHGGSDVQVEVSVIEVGNHPVKNLVTEKVEITSQNHGFAVDPESVPDGRPRSHTSISTTRPSRGCATSGSQCSACSTIQRRPLDRTDAELSVLAVSWRRWSAAVLRGDS